MLHEASDRVEFCISLFPEKQFCIGSGFLLPVIEGNLHRYLNVIFFADFHSFFRRYAGMDDAVPVVLPRHVVQCRLDCFCRLIKGLVPDRMHLDLKSKPVCFYAELGHLLIGIIQYSAVGRIVRIRLIHGSILRAEATVKCAGEASPDSRQVSCFCSPGVHGLGENTNLKSVLQASGKPALH